jgi:hypothetical protein
MWTRRTFLASSSAAALSAADNRYVRISRHDRRYFELSDGEPYIPNGLNLIAPRAKPDDPEGGLKVFETWLDNLAQNRGNYIRVWLSSPFWDIEHRRAGEYDEEKAARTERMLAMCAARGIRVKMTMEHFRSIGDGKQPWADKPLHHVSNGGTAESIADWFDGEKSRAQFRNKIRWYAARFGPRPEIFGWELWNEVNAVRGGDYLPWTEAMLPELHKAFPRNLCMQSLGSFDADRWREPYRRHSLIPTNDLAQVHRYLDLGAQLEICKGPVDVLAADATRELLGYKPNKPVILAESGAVEPRHTGPFKFYAADREGIILHDVLFAPFFSGAAGAGQIWHWDVYVDANNLWHHFARFHEAVKGLDPARERFTPSVAESGRLRVYTLTGRKSTLLWCRDTRNDWRAELERSEPPELIRDAALDLSKRSGAARLYDPWTNEWTTAQIRSSKIILPPFRRSLVVRAS